MVRTVTVAIIAVAIANWLGHEYRKATSTTKQGPTAIR